MAAASSIARWLLDEASSGTTPTECADDQSSNTLTIDYSSGDANWTSVAAGNGLDFTASAGATDAAVAIISGHLTTMARDICAKHAPSQFPHSMYLIGLQQAWIFDEPFHTQPLDIENIKPDSPTEDLAPEEKESTLRFLQELLDNNKT